MSTSRKQTREQFEQWARLAGFGVEKRDGYDYYKNADLNLMYMAWRASRTFLRKDDRAAFAKGLERREVIGDMLIKANIQS